jgi:zinc protease
MPEPSPLAKLGLAALAVTLAFAPAAALAAPKKPAPAAAAPAQTKPLFKLEMKTDKLENGLQVVRVPFNSPGLIAYYTIVRVGSRNEVEPGHTGFAHFFEHVMFKGTPKYPAGARDAILTAAGFDDNAFTTDDITVYHATGPNTIVDKLVELEADRFRNLQYSEQTFQTEAKAVLGEYHKSAADPELRIEEEMMATVFTKHTYQHTTIGFYQDIKKMPERYQYSLEFFKRWYTPDNAVVLVVGDFDDAKLMESVRAHYGPWQGKVATVEVPVEPPQRAERRVHIDWTGPTLPRHIHAWHTPAATLDNVNAATQTVLAAYLLGPTSPLHKELVLDKQLVEYIASDYSMHRDPYLFSMRALLKHEKYRPDVKRAFDAAIKQMAGGRVDAKRVEEVKSHLRYAMPMRLETPSSVGTTLAVHIGILGSADALERHFANIARVRPADLHDMVKRNFRAANRSIVTLTPRAPPSAQKGSSR